MRVPYAAIAAAAILATGCGYIGQPLPPLANIPAAVQSLQAVERGPRIEARFSLPDRTTEGMPIREPLKLDLRIGAAPSPFNVDQWAGSAEPVTGGAIDNGAATFLIPAQPWIGKEVAIGMRATGANGKTSGWSNIVIFPVVAQLEPPSGVKATATPQGVRLTWTGSAAQFRVFRRVGESAGFTEAATATQTEWTDAAAEFGKRYVYRVESMADLGGGRRAESEFSQEAAITPLDEFPPAVPAGVKASPAPASIELTWEPNTEEYLGGYRVYRSVGNGEMQKVAEASAIPSYSDHAVEAGKTYRYAVSAVGKTGYESPRSEPVEAGLPQ